VIERSKLQTSLFELDLVRLRVGIHSLQRDVHDIFMRISQLTPTKKSRNQNLKNSDTKIRMMKEEQLPDVIEFGKDFFFIR